MKLWIANSLIISILIINCNIFASISLSEKDAYALGMRVWKNESGKSMEGLTWWNPNEAFPSMGIGHFIWFPKKEKKLYEETFPSLILFLKNHKVKIPNWLLKENVACPWNSKKDFDRALKSKKMEELRALLKNSISEQALFIAYRLENSLPKILATLSSSEKEHASKMFSFISDSPQGIYALADYVNFKGEGVSSIENHQHGGWGLKQVLLGIPEGTEPNRALWEFVRSAKKRLLERVLENPNRKDERRWLIGWKKRLDSYLID